jgi:type IX secretion system PorP/SprF family membrane protein
MKLSLQKLLSDKKLIAVIVLLLVAFTTKAQDPEFTQFYAAPVYTNPALAGTAVCNDKQAGGRMSLNYRNQWPSLPGNFKTVAASFDQYSNSVHGGVGMLAMNDVAGDGLLTTTSVSGVYSFMGMFGGRNHKRFGFNLAMQAGIMQRSIDFGKLHFGDEIVAKRGFVNQTQETFATNTVTFPNFSAGGLLYSGSFYAGFAVHNITEPNQSFFHNTDPGTTLPRRFTLHAGTVIPIGKVKPNQADQQLTISPNILIMTQQKFFQTNIGFYLNKGMFVSGLWFRQTAPNSDALIAMVGFKLGKLKFGYSYDITVSGARSAATGSHEVSLSMEWCVKRHKGWKPIKCPTL